LTKITKINIKIIILATFLGGQQEDYLVNTNQIKNIQRLLRIIQYFSPHFKGGTPPDPLLRRGGAEEKRKC